MFDWEFFIVRTFKALVEVATMALLAQGLVGLISGQAKHENFVYRLFQVVTRPVIKLTRALTPRLIADQHMGITSFFLLLWVWLSLIFVKSHICHVHDLACFGS